jgi:outer membrane protein
MHARSLVPLATAISLLAAAAWTARPAQAAALQEPPPAAAAAQAPAPEGSLRRVTLNEALRQAANLDPDYVAALRQIGDAAWVRRAAWSAFFIPSIDFQWSFARFSTDLFNPGTNALTDRLSQASLSAGLDLFRGGARFFDLRGAAAGVESAEAGELRQRFQTALQTEADYYDVIAQTELLRVAQERVRRAGEQLAVARARVSSGAAVRTDSLQLLLELTKAQVDLLGQVSRVKVARLQLGRRVGVAGPVDAAPLDTLPAPELPVTEAEAVAEAVAGSPGALVARANERVASEAFKSERAANLPSLTLFGQWTGFDDDIIPDATTRTAFGLAVTLPIWDGAQREIRLYQARSRRKVAEAARRDAELAAGRDITAAYDAYETARASVELASRAVLVATENLRVQEERYRAGATTIIDLITAQVDLTEAEAGRVQARFETRLALAGVEAILGRRLFSKREGYD